MRIVWLIGLTLSAGAAGADDAASLTRTGGRVVSPADVGQWLLALLVVLAVFFLAVWLLRKTGGFGIAAKGPLAVVAGLPLGAREKLVLVRVGEKQLLLGVSSGRIDKLLELEGDQRLFLGGADTAETSPFAKKLLEALQGRVG